MKSPYFVQLVVLEKNISIGVLDTLKNFICMPYLLQLQFWFFTTFYVFTKFSGYLYHNLEASVEWCESTERNSGKFIQKINLIKSSSVIYTICTISKSNFWFKISPIDGDSR